jgi:5-methylcytosine-specific restriction enzyme subunit McrC
MQVKTVSENTVVKIDPSYVEKLRLILMTNYLPLKIEGETIIFEDYTIGEFRIDDLTIYIEPRNKAFTLNKFFQILQFIENPLNNEIEGFGFDETQSLFKHDDLSKSFCFTFQKLLQFGLTGNYQEKIVQDKIVHGEIVFENFFAPLIPYDGISTSTVEYNLNTRANQILKAAVSKLIQLEEDCINPEKFQILRDLENVDDQVFIKEAVEKEIRSFNSSNPFYSIALDYAFKILFNLKLEFKNGELEWLAFLENSNDIFEKYVLKILEIFLPEKVEKWKKPQKFAILKSNEQKGEKSYSPDIIIGFNKKTNSSRAVLDVKNKSFEPVSKTSLSELVSSSDLYQLLFYSRQLKTNLGGLIYPSTTNNEPIQIVLDTEEEAIIYLFSINMSENITVRHNKLISDIKLHLLNRF